MTRTRLGALVLVAILAVFTTACTATMDDAKIEKSAKRFLKDKLPAGETVKNVKCPSGKDAKDGVKFDCTYEGSEGTTGTLKIEVTSSDGDYNLEIGSVKFTAASVEKAIEDDFKTNYPDDADQLQGVDCPDDIPSEAGDTAECTITSTDGQTGTLPLTVDDQGTVNWDFSKVNAAG